MNYAIVDESNAVINTVVWNGTDQWQPPQSTKIIPITDAVNPPIIGGVAVEGDFQSSPPSQFQV